MAVYTSSGRGLRAQAMRRRWRSHGARAVVWPDALCAGGGTGPFPRGCAPGSVEASALLSTVGDLLSAMLSSGLSPSKDVSKSSPLVPVNMASFGKGSSQLDLRSQDEVPLDLRWALNLTAGVLK